MPRGKPNPKPRTLVMLAEEIEALETTRDGIDKRIAALCAEADTLRATLEAELDAKREELAAWPRKRRALPEWEVKGIEGARVVAIEVENINTPTASDPLTIPA